MLAPKTSCCNWTSVYHGWRGRNSQDDLLEFSSVGPLGKTLFWIRNSLNVVSCGALTLTSAWSDLLNVGLVDLTPDKLGLENINASMELILSSSREFTQSSVRLSECWTSNIVSRIVSSWLLVPANLTCTSLHGQQQDQHWLAPAFHRWWLDSTEPTSTP